MTRVGSYIYIYTHTHMFAVLRHFKERVVCLSLWKPQRFVGQGSCTVLRRAPDQAIGHLHIPVTSRPEKGRRNVYLNDDVSCRWYMRQIDYKYGALVGRCRQGEAEVLGEKSVPMPLCSPQTLNELACHRTRASVVVFHLSMCGICGVISDNTAGALCIY